MGPWFVLNEQASWPINPASKRATSLRDNQPSKQPRPTSSVWNSLVGQAKQRELFLWLRTRVFLSHFRPRVKIFAQQGIRNKRPLRNNLFQMGFCFGTWRSRPLSDYILALLHPRTELYIASVSMWSSCDNLTVMRCQHFNTHKFLAWFTALWCVLIFVSDCHFGAKTTWRRACYLSN